MHPDPPRALHVRYTFATKKIPRAARAAWPYQPHSMYAPPPSSTSGSAPVELQLPFKTGLANIHRPSIDFLAVKYLYMHLTGFSVIKMYLLNTYNPQQGLR